MRRHRPEESRKRKQSSPSVRGFSLQPVDATSEWTALAEDKAAGIDRFGRATMFTTRGGERWLAATTTLRGLIHHPRPPPQGVEQGLPLVYPHHLRLHGAAVGGDRRRDCCRGPALLDHQARGHQQLGVDGGRRGHAHERRGERPRARARPSRVDERGAITALLGTGWDFARAERHGPGSGRPPPSRDTVHLIRRSRGRSGGHLRPPVARELRHPHAQGHLPDGLRGEAARALLAVPGGAGVINIFTNVRVYALGRRAGRRRRGRRRSPSRPSRGAARRTTSCEATSA